MKTAGWIWLAAIGWAGCADSGTSTPRDCLADRSCRVPIVCAHRGLCGQVPENTLAGFLACERASVPMLEVDTRETSDLEIVVMHDDTVDRTTDGEQRFPGRTAVDQLSLEEFKSLVIDHDSCRVDPGADPELCHPPTLVELIESTSDQTLLFIDFKSGDSRRLARAVEAIADRVILYDPSIQVLEDYRAVLPNGLVMPRATSAEEVGGLMAEVDALDLRWIHADPGFVAEASAISRDGGVRLYVDGFGNVDTFLAAAELTQDPEARAEFERQAWEGLEAMIQAGASGFGTNFSDRYAEYLYPQGFKAR